MKVQFRSANGQSFWNLTDVSWSDLMCGKPDDSSNPWVFWQGRTWLRKYKDDSIREVVGYQIAEALKLPLQPWAGFFRNERDEFAAPRSGVGILIEKWPGCVGPASIGEPAASYPDIVSKALALSVLGDFEWPEWLANEQCNEIRLIELEHIGPFLHWPPDTTPLADYIESTVESFDEAREEARGRGILELFNTQLQSLSELDFLRILDFSGHPDSDAMKRVIVTGLEARRKKAVKILNG